MYYILMCICLMLGFWPCIGGAFKQGPEPIELGILPREIYYLKHMGRGCVEKPSVVIRCLEQEWQ